jgi:hypothetical protein
VESEAEEAANSRAEVDVELMSKVEVDVELMSKVEVEVELLSKIEVGVRAKQAERMESEGAARFSLCDRERTQEDKRRTRWW